LRETISKPLIIILIMSKATRRKVLRLLTYGLYIITTRLNDQVHAGLISWLSQASFNPPLIMVAIRSESKLYSLINESRVFAVNILSADQKDVASAFFSIKEVKNKMINGYLYEEGEKTGSPILIDLPAWFECRVIGQLDKGDHTVFLAEVVNSGLRKEIDKPLILWDTGWHYGG